MNPHDEQKLKLQYLHDRSELLAGMADGIRVGIAIAEPVKHRPENSTDLALGHWARDQASGLLLWLAR